MNANATASSGTKKTGTRQSHVTTFSKVLDGRKQPVLHQFRFGTV
jgi:hypothetical protein